MKNEVSLAQGWLRKADSDLQTARRTVESEGPYDTACFHAQQAVEKCLKALLALRGRPTPRTHDLEELADICLGICPLPELTTAPLEELSTYAVEMRYDADFWPPLETAAEALETAERIRNAIGALIPCPSNDSPGCQ